MRMRFIAVVLTLALIVHALHVPETYVGHVPDVREEQHIEVSAPSEPLLDWSRLAESTPVSGRAARADVFAVPYVVIG